MKYPLRSFASAFLILITSGLAAELSWRPQLLHRDHNEGLAVGDINGDGKADISAGEHWYPAPEFPRRALRKMAPFGKDYLQNNGEHLYDFNGDQRLDVVAGRFTETRVFWYENPGPEGWAANTPWPEHLLMDTGTGQNEINFFRDFDGDGVPEWIENSWNNKAPTLLWKLVQGEDGSPTMKKHRVSAAKNGHGMGFGDVNGDGREDIVFKNGWFECPPEGPFAEDWTHHPDFTLPHACCPILLLDLDEDGRNDILWANGHGYGIYWKQQLPPHPDGTTAWKQHVIDNTVSQAHAIAWEDIDNDGHPELITGKRYLAHSGRDPGARDPNIVLYYKWHPADQRWSRHVIAEAPSGEGPGIGLQIRVVDLDENGWKDVVVPGKSGTYILWNQGR